MHSSASSLVGSRRAVVSVDDSRSANAYGVWLTIGRVEKTTSRKLARARLLERQQAAAAERETRERANIGNLTEFTVRAAQADEVDEWLQVRIEKLRAEAEGRRHRHRVAAGKALHAMRLRGESISAIAAQAGLPVSRVREYLRAALETSAAGQPPANVVPAQVLPLPSQRVVSEVGCATGDEIGCAQ